MPFFESYVLRTPIFSVDLFKEVLENYSFKKLLHEYSNNKVFQTAIELASPELVEELNKLILNDIDLELQNVAVTKLEIALYKYFARSTSRCTPFGLFAGCSVGKFSNITNIKQDSIENFIVHSQFDMQYSIDLISEIEKNDSIRYQLKFKANNSLYKIGDYYRFIQYKYLNKKRTHQIIAIRSNKVLDILYENQNYRTINEFINIIVESEDELEDAKFFIEELINCQFLISELEPQVTSSKDGVFSILNFELEEKIKKQLISVADLINKFQINNLNLKEILQTSQSISDRFSLKIDKKNVIQSDLYLNQVENTLSKKNAYKLERALTFLSKIQNDYTNYNLENFKKAFIKKYESKQVPLNIVLDTDIGIGYLQNDMYKDSHSFLDTFSFSKDVKQENSENWTKFDKKLEKILIKSYRENVKIITISEKDFDLTPKSNLPNTYSVIAEIFVENNAEKISLESSGTISATKLLGRFTIGNNKIKELTEEVALFEKEAHPNKILAEICHIPESRTGNVIKRTLLREFEIPYLAKNSCPNKNKIDLADLMVSVKNNRVVLYSEKHKREIIPCLSNAHNYTNNALPIYQFLCDLQGQDIQPIFKFDWGILLQHFSYFPRVEYSGIILSKQMWIIELEELLNYNFGIDFQQFLTEKKITRFVTIVNGDNTLLLDLEVAICFEVLINTLKKDKKIILQEYLNNDSVVKDKNGCNYANQFIILYNN